MHAADAGFAALAFLLGGLMSRTTLCSVANIQQWVVARQGDGLLRLLVVTCSAGIVLLALQEVAPASVRLPAHVPITASVIVGGVLLGMGAIVNGACVLGTVLYLGRGNANFLATLLGLALSLQWIGGMPSGLASDCGAAHADLAASLPAPWTRAVAFLAFAIGLLATALWLRGASRRGQGAQASIVAAAAAGCVAGLIYAGHPDWNYATVLDAAARLDSDALSRPGQVAGLLLLLGATVGSLQAGRWRRSQVSGLHVLRCLAGGALMGAGALMIPGGHDLLLLWAVPGLALHGLAAFLAMAVTVALLLFAARGQRRSRG